MSEATKFFKPGDNEEFVFITSDQKGRNLKVYYQSNVILSAPDGILAGTSATAETTNGTFIVQRYQSGLMQVKLNNIEYIAEHKKFDDSKLSGVSMIFWILAAFSGLFTLFYASVNSQFLHILPVMIEVIIGISATLIYAVAAVLISMRFYWFYFVGLGLYTITTLLFIFGGTYLSGSLVLIAVLCVRITLLTFLLMKFKEVLTAMKDKSIVKTEALIDQE